MPGVRPSPLTITHGDDLADAKRVAEKQRERHRRGLGKDEPYIAEGHELGA